MIEREFIAQKTKEYYIKKYVEESLGDVGVSDIMLKKIPLGEKIIIYTSRPSLIVGSKGANIRNLTKMLKKKFNLENPQIEINEIKNIFLDANIVAERIVSSLEKFGSARFKGVGHKMLENVMNAGAKGIEIVISGKIPSARAKSWRFYMGYLKKCGDVAITGVRRAKKSALLKSGIIGVKVSIMPPDLVLPDFVKVLDEPEQIIEEIKEEKSPQKGSEKGEKKAAKPRAPRKKSPKKKEEAKEAKPEILAEKETLTEKGSPAAEEKTEAAQAAETGKPAAEEPKSEESQ